jgi:hypothetical protein
MLGWEFPPLFSGGLGVATYGIVKALSRNNSIRLIIPSTSHIDLQNVNIVGLNKIEAKEINLEKLRFGFSFLESIHQLPIAISPYHHINENLETISKDEFELLVKGKATVSTIHHLFSGKEVYGPDIMHKVYVFSKLAEQIALKSEFDLIHAHDWVTYQAGINIKMSTGKPLVLHVHALETDRAGESARNEIYELEKGAMIFADKIIAVSQYTKNQIALHYGIDPSKISVVHNGIEQARPERKKHHLKDKLVVFLGRLTNQKGPEFLLETARKVCTVFPRVKFVVAGTGDMFTHLLETSAYHKLGSKFIFTGFLSKEKANELLSMADVYFMPSVSEPFGLSALEAAQHQVPSVISNRSGAAEVMPSSLTADFWDTDKYANYIHALLRYHVLSKEISTKAHKQLDSLTWDHASEKIEKIYHQILNNN